jgi:ribonucleotide monophosphatase NagD (HAD superfamily)
MLDIPISALLLAGFALAHAAWSVSDTTPAELLVPLTFVEQNGQRALRRYEAPTQVEAIRRGKAEALELSRTADAWAFAREGALRVPATNPDTQDVLVIDLWAKGMVASATLVQRFERSTDRTHFRIVGKPVITISGHELDSVAAERLVKVIHQGIATHKKVAALWPTWQ